MLDPRQIASFFDVGFVVLPGVFRKDEVAELRAAFARLEQVARRLERGGLHRGSTFVLDRISGRSPSIRRVVWCGAAEPVLERYGRDSRLLRAAAVLLDSREMQQLINQAHFKLPGDEVEFPWHQDSSHRRYGTDLWRDVNGRGSYVQTVTAIDDMGEDNGPLEFVPDSCRRGHVPLPEQAEGCLPPELIDERRAVPLLLEAGGVALFGPYTFHRSGPNRSARPRRAFINGFAAPGANSRVYPGCGAGRSVRA